MKRIKLSYAAWETHIERQTKQAEAAEAESKRQYKKVVFWFFVGFVFLICQFL